MKVLSRDFTLKEKILLLLLFLIILGLAYYRFIHIPCKEAIETAHNQRDTFQTELTGALAKEQQLKKMKEELDSLGELQSASRMDSYNNSKAELTMLNNVLESAYDYSIKFNNVTRDGDQIRRNFSLYFETDSFASAKRIIEQLTDSEYRCLLGNMQYGVSLKLWREGDRGTVIHKIDDKTYVEFVTVNTAATFYETMYDGVPDDGLPKSK